MQIRFLPDKPVTDNDQDTLSFGPFLELLEESIYHTQTPFTYGVLGDWGVGKTSVLELLKQRLAPPEDDEEEEEETPKSEAEEAVTGDAPAKEQEEASPSDKPHLYLPIWFNAWKYENETNIIYPLLHAIKRSYEKRLPVRQLEDKFLAKMKEVSATSMLALTDVGLRAATRYLTGDALKLDDLKKQWEAVKERPGELDDLLSGWADEVTALEDKFDALLEAYATDWYRRQKEDAPDRTPEKADDYRFVIIIDDLDRCLPETSIRILEGIKNFLTTERTIFVLGLNPAIVYKGIAIKYRGLEVNGREYLEKILNYSFHVPEPSTKNVEAFVADQFERLVPAEADREPYGTQFAEFADVLDKGNFTNPRKVKRILNRYLFFLKMNGETLGDYDNGIIVRLIVLAEYYPRLFHIERKNVLKGESNVNLGDPGGFNLEKFERLTGLSIQSIYAELQERDDLFNLNRHNSVSISQHAEAVHRLAQGV